MLDAMGDWRLERGDDVRVLTSEGLQVLRKGEAAGLSRRQLLRRTLGAGIALWLAEVLGGTIGFLWPNLASGFGSTFVLGDFETVAARPAIPEYGLADGAPAYIAEARTFVTLLDATRRFTAGENPDGAGATTNVRTLYQRCTHLGCKPNFCARNFWFECPCHGSRYDRLGIKVAGLGPAPRGLDRFASTVDADGVLSVDTSRITLGPLPIVLGQPGLIASRSSTGCL